MPLAAQSWHGLNPKVIDGTTVSLPDTPKNQRAYPQARSQKPGGGFPLLKMAGVFSLASGVLLDYAKGNKHQSVTLVTTLLDPKMYPAEDLARLYARRWRIELWFRDIKTSMGMEVLRCQTPKNNPRKTRT